MHCVMLSALAKASPNAMFLTRPLLPFDVKTSLFSKGPRESACKLLNEHLPINLSETG